MIQQFPCESSGLRHDYCPTVQEMQAIALMVGDDWQIPKNFVKSVPAANEECMQQEKKVKVESQKQQFLRLIGLSSLANPESLCGLTDINEEEIALERL